MMGYPNMRVQYICFSLKNPILNVQYLRDLMETSASGSGVLCRLKASSPGPGCIGDVFSFFRFLCFFPLSLPPLRDQPFQVRSCAGINRVCRVVPRGATRQYCRQVGCHWTIWPVKEPPLLVDILVFHGGLLANVDRFTRVPVGMGCPTYLHNCIVAILILELTRLARPFIETNALLKSLTFRNVASSPASLLGLSWSPGSVTPPSPWWAWRDCWEWPPHSQKWPKGSTTSWTT